MPESQEVMVGDLSVTVDFYHARNILKAEKMGIRSNVKKILGTRPPAENIADKVTEATILVHTDNTGHISRYGIYYHLTPNKRKGLSSYKNVRAEELSEKSV